MIEVVMPVVRLCWTKKHPMSATCGDEYKYSLLRCLVAVNDLETFKQHLIVLYETFTQQYPVGKFEDFKSSAWIDTSMTS